MKRPPKYVYQIVDSPSRDLEWRLFLSYKLSQSGIASCIGHAHDIELLCNVSQNALLVGRFGGNSGRAHFDKRLIAAMKKNSISMFFWHDEGAFYFNDEYEAAVNRIYPEAYFNESFMKAVYFWGEKQREVFNKNSYSANLKILGSPRFDLFKSKYDYIESNDIQNIRNTYGSFTLICSRFAGLHPVKGDVSYTSRRMLEIKKEAVGDDTVSDVVLMGGLVDAWKNVATDQAVFISAIYSLCSQRPKENFIYRPHPAEDMRLVNDIFSVLPNVVVSKSEDLRTVVKAAKLVIHSESTSGFEAGVCGLPTINLVTQIFPKKKGIAGVSEVGHIVYDDFMMIDAFDSLVEQNKGRGEVSITYTSSQYVYNCSSDVDALELLVADIVEHFEQSEETKLTAFDIYNVLGHSFTLRYWLRKFYLLLRSAFEFGEAERKKKVGRGDIPRLKQLWSNFGGNPNQLSMKGGSIFVEPEQ